VKIKILIQMCAGLCLCKSYAQKPFELGILQDYGFILRHSVKVGHLQSRPRATTIFYTRNHLGDKEWEHRLHYPKSSFEFTYFDFQNPIIGETFALTANMYVPIYRRKVFQSEWKIGTGLVYATNPFNLQNNFRNNVLSNRWSYVMQTGFYGNWQIHKHWQLKSALQLTHYSNGAYKLPNAGVNVITASLGTAYLFHPEKISIQAKKDSVIRNQWIVQSALSLSWIETVVNQPRKHHVVNTQLQLARDASPSHRVQLGIDVSWNEGIRYQIQQKYKDSSSRPDYRRIGVVVGDEIKLGKMSLNVQIGVYVYRNYQALTDMMFYQRYGLKYYWHRNIWSGLFLKSHAATAEAAEFTIGGHFPLK
jgi:hypothetical protein